ncbi:glucosaminidase domain-containing protein [Lewinella cohaerens]|uniref:glucosaminidase domain-containing protein n=1 Tax=Lewinella cohaerens TaxID=70995 RepID=UPI00035C2B7C|nr:glucosaminidase domain-containing protein [Lewinella cohaerens]
MDGFLPVFGFLVLAGGGYLIYEQGFSEFRKLPLIQEITDAYLVGWEQTSNFGEQLATHIIMIDKRFPAYSTSLSVDIDTEESLQVRHNWNADVIANKLAKEGWSSGKLNAANAYLAYIESYLDEALYDMYNTNVSASITIAQGILESDAGRSRLARTTNNHFGIKALPNANGRKKIKSRNYGQLYDHDFTFKKPAIGVSQHHDDHKYDRFETYLSVQDSYRRHSNLLKNKCTTARKGCYAWIWEAFPVQKERIDITEMASIFQNTSGIPPEDFFGYTTLPYYAAQAAGLKMAGYATSKSYHKKLVYLIETYELWRLDAALSNALNS